LAPLKKRKKEEEKKIKSYKKFLHLMKEQMRKLRKESIIKSEKELRL
jgi:hypothetical protein